MQENIKRVQEAKNISRAYVNSAHTEAGLWAAAVLRSDLDALGKEIQTSSEPATICNLLKIFVIVLHVL